MAFPSPGRKGQVILRKYLSRPAKRNRGFGKETPKGRKSSDKMFRKMDREFRNQHFVFSLLSPNPPWG
jgi:hypothetical protein